MAVRVGFEPTVDCYTYGNLANFWFKPLTHLTKIYFVYHVQKIKKTFFSSLKVLIIIDRAIKNIIRPKTQFIINNT